VGSPIQIVVVIIVVYIIP